MPHTSPNMKLNLCIIESHEHIVRHLSINDVAQIPLFPYQLHVITLQLHVITPHYTINHSVISAPGSDTLIPL